MAEGKEIFEIIAKTDGVTKGVRDAENQFGDLAASAQNAGSKMDAALKKVGMAVGSYFAIGQIQEFAREIINVRSEIEKYQVSFTTLLGDKNLGDQLFGDIKEFANSTPLLLKDLASAAQTMLGFGIDAQRIMPLLKQIGDVSMGDSQKMQSLTLAFSQMSATGKLMGQDLLQMINAGFNPLNEMARTTGKSMAELKDEMSKGEISAQMVADAFKSATSEGGQFQGMMEAQSKTIQGSISNLQGAFDDMLNTIGEQAQPVITETIAGLTELVKNYEAVGRAVAVLVTAYGTYKAASTVAIIVKEITALGSLTAALKSTAVAQGVLNVVANANPYVLLATAIVGVVTALYEYIDYQNDATNAAESYAGQQERINGLIDEQKTKVDELMDIVTDETQSEEDRNVALRQLQKIMPNVFGKYKTAIELSEKQTEALRDENAEWARRNQLMGKEAHTNDLNTLSLYKQYQRELALSKNGPNAYTHQQRAQGLWEQLAKEYSMEHGNGNGGQSIDVMQKWIDNVGKRTREYNYKAAESSQVDYNAALDKMSNEAIIKDQNYYRDLLKKYKSAYITINGIVLSREQIQERIDKGGAAINSKRTADNPKTTKQYWEDKKKAAETEYESMTDEERASKKGVALANNIKQYKQKIQKIDDATSVSSSASNNAAKKQEQQRAEQAKRDAQYLKDQKENAKLQRDLKIEEQEKDIATWDDGTKKEIATLNLNREKVINAYTDKEDELLEKMQEAEKSEWMKNNPGKKDYQFIPTITKDSEAFRPYREQIAALKNEVNRATDQSIQAIADKNRIDYVEKFGSAQERIDLLGEQLEKAMAATDDENLKNTLWNEYKEAVRQIENEGIEVQIKFGNLNSQLSGLTEQLRSTLDKATEDWQKDAARKEYGKNVIDTIFSENNYSKDDAGIKMMAKDAKQLYEYLQNPAMQEKPAIIKDANVDVAALQGDVNVLQQLFEIANQPTSGGNNFFSNLISGFKSLKNARNYAKQIKELKNSANPDTNRIAELEAFKKSANADAAQKFGAAMQVVGNSLGNAAQSMRDLADATNDFDLAETADAMGSFAESLSATGQGLASGGWVGAVIGGVTDFFNQAVSAAAQFQKELEQLKVEMQEFRDEIELLDLEVNDADYSSVFGDQSVSKLADTWSKAREALEKYTEKLNGADLKNMNVRTIDRAGIANLFGISDTYERLASLAPEIWGDDGVFDPDAAQKFLDTTSKLSDEQREEIQNIIDLNTQYQDLMDTIDQGLEETYGSWASDLTDALFDSVRSGKDLWTQWQEIGSDAIDSLGKQMMQELFVTSYFEQFQDRMEKAYSLGSADAVQKELASITKDMFTGLQANMGYWQDLAQQWDDMAEEYGYTLGDKTDQSSSSNAVASMSEETANELNGRFTSMQLAMQQMYVKTAEAQADLGGIASNMEAMQAIGQQSLNHLAQIERYTSVLPEIRDDIKTVKSNTNRL